MGLLGVLAFLALTSAQDNHSVSNWDKMDSKKGIEIEDLDENFCESIDHYVGLSD